MYYVKGKPKEKLSRFLVYFQRYLLTKQYIPLHVEFAILDTLDGLEEQARDAIKEAPRKGGRGSRATTAAEPVGAMFPRFESLEAAQAAVDVFETVPEEERLRLEKEQEREAEEELEDRDDEQDDEEVNDAAGETGDGADGNSSSSDDEGNEGSEGEEEEEDDEEARRAAQREEEERSERMAAKMMEKLRIAEEDDEFEKALKNVMQVSWFHFIANFNFLTIMMYLVTGERAQCLVEEQRREQDGNPCRAAQAQELPPPRGR